MLSAVKEESRGIRCCAGRNSRSRATGRHSSKSRARLCVDRLHARGSPSWAAAENSNDLNYGIIALLWRGGASSVQYFSERSRRRSTAIEAEQPATTSFKEKIEASRTRGGASSRRHHQRRGEPRDRADYFDGYRTERLPANLLQAQRIICAHEYERTDKPRGEFFHTNWTGRGGETASSTYKV